jgi:hypothetical protein
LLCSYIANLHPDTKVGTITYDVLRYFGDYGKTNARMNQGFTGTVVAQIYNFNTFDGTYDYWTEQFNLQGFQRFNHQFLSLSGDSRIGGLPSEMINELSIWGYVKVSAPSFYVLARLIYR